MHTEKDIKKNKKPLVNKSEIARRLDVTPQYISLIFGNKRKAPKMREKISRLLDQEIKAA